MGKDGEAKGTRAPSGLITTTASAGMTGGDVGIGIGCVSAALPLRSAACGHRRLLGPGNVGFSLVPMSTVTVTAWSEPQANFESVGIFTCSSAIKSCDPQE